MLIKISGVSRDWVFKYASASGERKKGEIFNSFTTTVGFCACAGNWWYSMAVCYKA